MSDAGRALGAVRRSAQFTSDTGPSTSFTSVPLGETSVPGPNRTGDRTAGRQCESTLMSTAHHHDPADDTPLRRFRSAAVVSRLDEERRETVASTGRGVRLDGAVADRSVQRTPGPSAVGDSAAAAAAATTTAEIRAVRKETNVGFRNGMWEAAWLIGLLVITLVSRPGRDGLRPSLQDFPSKTEQQPQEEPQIDRKISHD